MQFSQLLVVLAIAVASANAAAIGVESRAVASVASLEAHPVYSRSALAARAATASSITSIESKAVSVQKQASSEYKSQVASLKSLNKDTVTADELKPIIAQITATTSTAGKKMQALSSQAKAAKNSKRQALLVPAVDELVVDLNNVIKELQPLLQHRE